MLNLRSLAQERASATSESEGDWQNAISRSYKVMSQQQMSDEEFSCLVQASCCANHLSLMAREFFRFSKQDSQQRSAYQLLSKEVEESEFGLEQWVSAIFFMFSWLEKNQKTADLPTVLGYLNCCAFSPDNKIGQRTLVSVTEEFLAAHGFERAT